MSQKILCVDDDARILKAFERTLHQRFSLDTAQGAAEGLQALERSGPYAVVVSDQQMPGMDGITFLTRVKERSPDTVRVMLTGQGDLATAMAAVNEGKVFQFLTKPCPPQTLARTLEAGLRQYQLITSERELLERTLMGSISVLTEILSQVHPAAFGKAVRIRGYVRHMGARLGLADAWQFEVAALLSQLGCISVPLGTLQKFYMGEPLSPEERRIISTHPYAGANLLRRIPRLEPVARMVEQQEKPCCAFEEGPAGELGSADLGAQMLKAALGFDELCSQGMSAEAALAKMRALPRDYCAQMLDALSGYQPPETHMEPRTLRARELRTGMVAAADVRTRSGLLVIGEGQEITASALERLKSFALDVGIVEPVQVYAPAPSAGEERLVPLGVNRCR